MKRRKRKEKGRKMEEKEVLHVFSGKTYKIVTVIGLTLLLSFIAY